MTTPIQAATQTRLSIELRQRMLMVWLLTPSVSEVSRRCGVAPQTVRRIREIDRWHQREGEFAQLIREKGETTLEDLRLGCDRVIRTMMADFIRRVEDGEIQIRDAYEFVTMGKFWLLLKGQPTEALGVTFLPSGRPVQEADDMELRDATEKVMIEFTGFADRLKLVEARGGPTNGGQAKPAAKAPAKPKAKRPRKPSRKAKGKGKADGKSSG